MNINCNQTNFGSAYVSKKGLEEVKKRPSEHIEKLLDVLNDAENNSIKTDFIVDDNGDYYVKHPKYGEVRVGNPSKPEVCDNYFCCNVKSKNGRSERIGISLPSKRDAQAIKENSFYAGAYMPDLHLALYRALEAEAAYKDSLMTRLEKFAK